MDNMCLRRSHLDEVDASLVGRGCKARHVPNDTASQGHKGGVAIQPGFQRLVPHLLEDVQGLVLLTVRQHDMLYLQPAVALPQGCIAPALPRVLMPARACVREDSRCEHTQGPTEFGQVRSSLPFQVKGCYGLIRNYKDLVPRDVPLYHRAII